jgi:3'-5' exoribonuclease
VDHVFIKELTDGRFVESVYYVRDKSLSYAKNNKAYLGLKLSDRSGDIEARVWDNAEYFNGRVAAGDFVFVRAQASLWQSQVQLKVTHLEAVAREKVDPADFLPVCPRDLEAYWRVVRETLGTIQDAGLRALCDAALADPEIRDGLRRAPAATGVHQPYLGGLLEHVCSLLLLADMVCRHYPPLDRDLMLAGVLFHDIGKIQELSYDYALDYRTEGRLLGHHLLGAQLLERVAATVPDLPRERVMLLEHLILSHHGRPEFGSSKIPMFAEAAVLHYLDNLDAKVFGFLEAEAEGEAAWSDRKWYLETAAYRLPREVSGYRIALPDKKEASRTKTGATDAELPLFKK